jgi:hypothetical protein
LQKVGLAASFTLKVPCRNITLILHICGKMSCGKGLARLKKTILFRLRCDDNLSTRFSLLLAAMPRNTRKWKRFYCQ